MCVYDPRTGKHELVNDAREEMQEITKQNPTSEEEKTAFYSHRRKLLEKAELSIEQKKHSKIALRKALIREVMLRPYRAESEQVSGTGMGNSCLDVRLRFTIISSYRRRWVAQPIRGCI